MLMLTSDLGALGYGLTALAFTTFWLMLLTGWKKRPQGLYLLTSVAVSVLWAATSAVNLYLEIDGLPLSMLVMEFLMMASWVAVLVKMVAMEKGVFWNAKNKFFVVCFLLLAAYEITLLVSLFLFPFSDGTMRAFLVGFIAMSVLGLVLVEQVYRNTKQEMRWAVKFFVMGVGALFAYNFYLFSDALLFGRFDLAAWFARGYAAILLVPLIAIFVKRNPEWSFDVFVSRGVAFHSVALFAVSIYLLVMAAGGYYIQTFGGDWGRAFQILFFFGAILLLAMIMLSGQLRSRLRVLVNKHFFNYKYDYREEWLGFTKTLSAPVTSQGGIHVLLLRALLNIIDAPEGVLWVASPGGYQPQAKVGMGDFTGKAIALDDELVLFLEETEWVINIDEYRHKPELYQGLTLSAWLRESHMVWLVVPLLEGERLIAMAFFSHPRSERTFNWEDSDLLKAAGRQAAISLSQHQMSQRLIDARQFEAYNSFSTFVIHDIKNMVAQLSLMVRNADKHKRNPEFVDDMVETTRNAVEKMERLVAQLKTGKESYFQQAVVRLNLAEVLASVIGEKSRGEPAPVLKPMPVDDLFIEAEQARLETIIGHLIQNAQDATPAEGGVTVSCDIEEHFVRITISDSGCGMSESFIQNRLFRPFDTTKGSSGMGIGAYESRAYIMDAGGRLEVESKEGEGSSFHVILPLSQRAE